MSSIHSEILAAAIDETNRWLVSQAFPFHLVSVTAVNARRMALDVERAGDGCRRVSWNWEDLFFRKVRHRLAWMYAMVRLGRSSSGARALCYGRIEPRLGYVSLEYMERARYARGLKGLTVLTAFRFARTVALLLGLDEVRVNQPFPELIGFYERVLRAVRHPPDGHVQYLYIKVQP